MVESRTPFNQNALFCKMDIIISYSKIGILQYCVVIFCYTLPFWSCPFLKCFNPYRNKPWFVHVYNISLLKTLWENEKLLVMSNFSFSHRVFYPFCELSTTFIKIKLSSANSFNLEESKNYFWERVKKTICVCDG